MVYDRKNRNSYRDKDRAKYNKKNKIPAAKYRARVLYGLTLEEYNKIISRGCEICGTNVGRLCIDHNHITGKIRGCLCGNCNHALGHLRDSRGLLLNAIKYLDETNIPCYDWN